MNCEHDYVRVSKRGADYLIIAPDDMQIFKCTKCGDEVVHNMDVGDFLRRINESTGDY